MISRIQWPLFALTVAAVLPATSRATDLTIENYTNGKLYVAMAYERWSGNLAATGWTVINSNDSHTFAAGDANDLYARVQDDSANEITWKAYDKFDTWPVSGDRFTVAKAPDDDTIRILKSGSDLSNSVNIRKGDALPDGWSNQRFFRVGPGAKKLRVDPN